jgi:hypothetical protein
VDNGRSSGNFFVRPKEYKDWDEEFICQRCGSRALAQEFENQNTKRLSSDSITNTGPLTKLDRLL